ncbi:zinc-binding dehydrogenase family oxidoreductase (macronuclear) [Tetrahymena thermophila SB210]|uniref:Zinc-binding dehydrogenase family oxidoreductase n=1 Tax=Tetrahymena thermophila (strain SB210) TaxID=312017 RepID=I7LUA5_TETTS|nr:zinc-binding dehydrogenase family oxidoreductase [Tetrahymena thermophila SB210]EAR90916.1 zinc-binding dehydrogenase family oxidoreductase [Tetrahymena thermophila SB210]|eukprot:XP_001011161.1 zinc-binding dehydrogenase family oxidoreductase [Tetrahymena thermophila SB210]
MSPKIPKTMKALVLEEFGKPVQLKEIPVPKPRYNEVLIKIEYAPLNPMDLSFLKGSYSSVKKLPVTPGFEGSGTVVASGGGLYGWSLIGKRVAVYVQRSPHGCYAEYAVTNAFQCITVPETVSFENAASGLVNPLTVVMMHKKTLKKKAKAIISNPGASAVGRMIYRYFTANGIKVINIVRRQEQVDLLKKEENAEYVLNSSDPNFQKDLNQLSKKLGATVSFDAVGGSLCAVILNNMPDGSSTYVYGNLSMKNSEASQNDLIFKHKKIKGFWLVDWMKKTSVLENYFLSKKLGSMYNNIMATSFARKYPLNQIEEACRFYLKNMTEGKILLSPSAIEISEINDKKINEQCAQQIQPRL